MKVYHEATKRKVDFCGDSIHKRLLNSSLPKRPRTLKLSNKALSRRYQDNTSGKVLAKDFLILDPTRATLWNS